MSFYKKDAKGKIKPTLVVGLDCQAAIEAGEEIRVEQSHVREVDINNIVRKHAGNMELITKISNLSNWRYDDVTGNDFQESMHIMMKARDSFMDVPSDIRKKFGNDPAAFMDFVQNKDNKKQLVEWGLANPPEAPMAPIEVNVVSSPETPQETA